MSLLSSLLGEPSNSSRFHIDADHINPKTDITPLTVDADYLRIVITEASIKNLTVLLRQYAPIIYGNVRFQMGAQMQTLTQVIDPRNEQYGHRGGSLALNQHLIRPIPFINPVVNVTLGLLRVKTADFAPAAITLLTAISSAVQPALAVGTKLAGILTQGVSDLLEDRQSLVLGISETFDEVNMLKPGYHVLVSGRDFEPSRFWIDNGRLTFGEDSETAVAFEQSDFMVYRVDRLQSRPDYWAVADVKEYYERALRAIQTANAKALNEAYGTLMRVIAASVEFTMADSQRMSAKVGKELQDRWEHHKVQVVQFKAGAEINSDPLLDVDPDSFASIVNWHP